MNDPLPPRTAVRRKILLVDDDPDLLALRKLRLQAEGYEVAEAREAPWPWRPWPRSGPISSSWIS